MISLIPLGITLIIMVGCFAFMAGMMPHVTEAMANFNSVIIEYINGMKLIKAYNMSRHSFQKFSGAIEEENRIWNKVSRKTGPFYAAFIVVLEMWNGIDYPHWRAVIFEWFNYSKHFSVVCVYWLSILIGIVAASAIIYGTGTIIKRR